MSEPRASAATISRLGLIAGPLVALAAYAVLPLQFTTVDGETLAFTHAGRATLAMMLWMATWWLTEAIDLAATSLLPLAAFPLLGIASMKSAAAPYGSDFIFLFMGGFILAMSMQRWGLDRRIALMTLRIVGSRPRNMVGGFIAATAMLSAFVSNTATAAMLLPVGISVIELVKRQSLQRAADADAPDRNGRNFALCLMLGIAYGASIGGVSTIIGTPPNVFLAAYLRDAFNYEVSFVGWMMLALPLVLVFLPVMWWLLTRVMYPVRMDAIEGGRAFIESSYRALGPMNRGERATFIVFCCAALAWITRPLLKRISLGIGDDAIRPFAGLEDAGIAMIAALALFLIPENWKRRSFVMNWSTAVKLPWGILILFGGGLSLAAAIEANGVAEFIGHQTSRFAGMPAWVMILIVTAAIVFFSEVASNTATATTLVPILAAMAPGLGIDPYLLIVPAVIAASCAFMMPVGTPPNALVFGTGYVTVAQMCKAGWWLNIIGIGLIVTLAMTLVPRLFGAAPMP